MRYLENTEYLSTTFVDGVSAARESPEPVVRYTILKWNMNFLGGLGISGRKLSRDR
jgi:hypothetical protein